MGRGEEGRGGGAGCRWRIWCRGAATVVPTYLQSRTRGRSALSFVSFFCLFSNSTAFSLWFPSTQLIVLGNPSAEDKTELATSHHRAKSSQETDCTYPRHDLPMQVAC